MSCNIGRVANALLGDYTSVYCIDPKTGYYECYSTNPEYKKLELHSSGEDFFADARRDIAAVVFEEDRAAVSGALTRESLIRQFRDRDAVSVVYRLMIDGKPVYHTMRIFRDAPDGDDCLVLGVMNVDGEKRRDREAPRKPPAENKKGYRDELTGVKNKAAFEEYEQELQERISRGRAEAFSVAVCDLNGLKEINDTRGRQAGDECIVAACRMICNIFQHSPVFRIGGDEFAAVLKGRDYVIRKELILALHDRSVEHIGTESPVISAGYSDYIPGEDAGFQAVLERAEAQMYEEKKLLKGMGEETREDGGEMSLAAEKARGFRTRRMRNDMTDNGRSGPAWNCTAIGA